MAARKLFNYWISKNRSNFFTWAAVCLAVTYFAGVMMTTMYEKPEMSALLKRIGFAGMVILALVYLIHQNLNAFYDFLKLFEDMDHVPRKQISYVNSFCMTVFLILTLAGTLALVALTEPVWQAIYRWFSEMPELTAPEPVIPYTEQNEIPLEQLSKLMGGAPLFPAWFKYVWKALDVVMWILFLAVIVLALRALMRSVWSFVIKPRHFDEDEKIYLKPTLKMSLRGNEPAGAKKDSSIRYLVSADARIRRHYKKAILSGRKQQRQTSLPPEWAAPAELEESAAIDDRVLHDMYEKARYSREGCTEEEWKKLSGAP